MATPPLVFKVYTVCLLLNNMGQLADWFNIHKLRECLYIGFVYSVHLVHIGPRDINTNV